MVDGSDSLCSWCSFMDVEESYPWSSGESSANR